MKNLLRRKPWLVAVALLVVTGVFASTFVASRTVRRQRSALKRQRAISADQETQEEEITTVKVIRPRFQKTFSRTVSGPAYVEAFYTADLFAHVAGAVKYVEKNIGERVVQGELLVEIDVPDLFQELVQKEAYVKQAQVALVAAEADVVTLKAQEKTGYTAIDVKLADLEREKALRDLRKTQMLRFKALAEKNTVAPETADEKYQEYRSCEASCKSAEASVTKARLDIDILRAKIAAAEANTEVQRQRIAVAQADMNRLSAQVEFARLRAPFNGIIVSRNVDPGSFVQNAATGRTQPIMSLVRMDKVTVAMQVPESAAPYVNAETQATIFMENEVGKPIRNLKGNVSRFAPFLDPERGRTMRLEVDLYNPPERGYRRSVTRGVSAMLATLGASGPYDAACLFHAGRTIWNRPGLLRPGMYGTMKLVLQRYKDVYLIPSGAVVSQQGRTFIFMVQDGVAKRLPARVQLDDGMLARVALLDREENPESGEEEVLRELTGNEDIIASGQGEITDGQEVLAVRSEW